MTKRHDLDVLCATYGIGREYYEIGGTRRVVPEKSLRALLDAMHVTLGEGGDLKRVLQAHEAASWRRVLPPVRVVRAASPDGLSIEISIAAAAVPRHLDWWLRLEDGTRHAGRFSPANLQVTGERTIDGTAYRRYVLRLPAVDSIGYHHLELEEPGDEPDRVVSMTLIVAPERCFQPQVLNEGGRMWGPTVQLYTLRSKRNWGIGDFSDLLQLVDFCAEAGAGIIGVNPLHALFPHDPAQASPYSPSSRLFLNVLYIAVDAVPEFQESEAIRQMVGADDFQARLRALRAAELVDYVGVTEVKIPVLRACHAQFRLQHLPHATHRADEFRRFQARHGEALHRHALFEALQAHFHADDPDVWGWPAWPEAYRDPSAPEVAEFARKHEVEVEFFGYLQWLADEQLAAVGRRSWELGLGIGAYQDLAVGVNPGGAEAWSNQDLYAIGVNVGAPADDFNANGQDWGLPPFIPPRLEESAYTPFIATLRANMRYAGALRIDHVMGLMRLFWIPAGAVPTDGAYVNYPLSDLLGILALESQRNQCLVIGEDLGTVPEGLRPVLAQMGVLAYRPLLFERSEDGSFKPPAQFPGQALVCVSTHDLPTLRGFWLGNDLDLRVALDLFPSEEMRESQVIDRAQDRARLLVALQREELLPPDTSVHPVAVPDVSTDLALAVHRYVARTPAQVMVVQMEDLLGVAEQVNLPGSDRGHPNWRRKLPLEVEQWPTLPAVLDLVALLREERGLATVDRPAGTSGPAAQIPLATYRLQLNRDFNFAQATEVLPYLRQLGVTHCYSSPYLKARPGSMHGYDIVNHSALNPEIGNEEDFERFVGVLHEHGMGQMLDIVPNHMGIMGSDNSWWLDVLENGPSSIYADYFDIDWESLKNELRGKVLLPLLGDHYGTVLSRGELKLVFDAARGEFSIFYYQHRLPVDPGEYPRILRAEGARGSTTEIAEKLHFAEFHALVNAFGHLPPRTEVSPEVKGERSRDTEVHKRWLADLCARYDDVAAFVAARVQSFNGVAGHPASFDDLHELIKAQAYRLAFWRVASDEINYRRFFDINDLAALRMEDEPVFAATHRRVIEWVKQGKVQGLRIDHPDGLYDPGQYFQRLQNSVLDGSGRTDRAKLAPSNPMSIYLVIEKILAEYERPPASWPVHGTTGYRFANVVGGLFVDTTAERRMTRIYEEFIGERLDFEALAYRSKKLIMQSALSSELNVLANQLSRIAQASRYTCDFTFNSLRDALVEIVACFPVYRSYVTPAGATAQDRRYIDWAVAVAKKMSRAADVSVFDFVRDVLTTAAAEGKIQSYRDRVTRFAVKFQQFSSPVMAKGVEDTSFYIYNRLVSLNEVGGDPRTFGFTLAAFHGASQDRAERWPHTMLATSTHDTKRSEDVRVRISVLTEMPAAWKLSLRRWSRMNRGKKRLVDGKQAPSRNDEYLLYQSLIGSWPVEQLDSEGLAAYCERIEQYMLKAVREAKVHTSWINPDSGYEGALSGFIRAILIGAPDKNLFLGDFIPSVHRLARFGLYGGLSQTLIKFMSPGVPDIYQGTEMWNFSLVDPDNRRPVDYALHRKLLDDLQSLEGLPAERREAEVRALIDTVEDGRIKLYVTWKALQLRNRYPDVFQQGTYVPLTVTGALADHVCAFARTFNASTVIVVGARFFVRMLDDDAAKPLSQVPWGDTWVALPAGCEAKHFSDVFFDAAIASEVRDGKPGFAVAPLLGGWPIALLASAADGEA